MKLVFFFNSHKLSGILTKFFTGCYAYHMGHYDPEDGTCWDMWLLRRSYNLQADPDYHGYSVVTNPEDLDAELKLGKPVMFITDDPVNVSRGFLEAKRMSTFNTYSIVDYGLFALRPIFHLFGKQTRNAKGEICSEAVYNDMKEYASKNNIKMPFEFQEIPSPCDLLKAIINNTTY